MTYTELETLMYSVWDRFYDTLEANDVDIHKMQTLMDSKGCVANVFYCAMESIELENEEMF